MISTLTIKYIKSIFPIGIEINIVIFLLYVILYSYFQFGNQFFCLNQVFDEEYDPDVAETFV